MLSSADVAVAARDPGLPGLRVLLDPEALRDAFRVARPDRAIDGVDVTYARYRPGKSCLVGCRIDIDGSPVAGYATTSSSAREPGAPLDDARRSIFVSMFPCDRKVSALAAIGEAQTCSRLLKDVLPTCEPAGGWMLEPLAYTPERRFVGKLAGSDGSRAVLKAYTDRAYQSACSSPPQIASRGSLRVATTLARSNRHRVVLLEWLRGRLLSEAILDPAFDLRLVDKVGRALADLHAQAPTGRTRMTAGATLESLRAEAAMIGRLCPALHERAHDVAEQLGASLSDRPPVRRPLHGDFHARQVMVDDDDVALFDFDGAFDGDPVLDLCSFVAGLARATVRGRLSERTAERVAEALVDGYEAEARVSVDGRMSFMLAVELFCLARRCFRGREPNWPDGMAAMLGRAEAAAARALQPTETDRGWLALFSPSNKEWQS